ncbi:MAG: eukaryotic-like serine/threonine-protein kinase [Gaiellales bacterium]|nr:eukaryotic-like serine/threonine-protein kinase [Gaiellales bacterium]
MSAVWLARDDVLDRDVAVKMLHIRRLESAEAVERFEREARTLASLTHPGIVTVIDRGDDHGRPFIVFEYVRGRDLRERIADEGRLPLGDVLSLGEQIADALAYAHARGVIHRDVKPHNILLTPDGQPKLTDFGIARVLEQPGLTTEGRVLGTGDYLAPEQAAGDAPDARADVYALGALLYHALCGAVPYHAESYVETARMHAQAPIPSVRGVRPDAPERLDEIVRRALAKRPEDRYPDAASLRDELHALSLDLKEHAQGSDEFDRTPREPSPPVRPPAAPVELPSIPGTPRRGLRIASIALLVLVLGAGAGLAAYLVHLRGSNSNAPPTRPTVGPTTQLVGTTPTTAPALTTVKILSATSYDPQGDDTESQYLAPRAIDGNPATFWRTETYKASQNDLAGKSGVGLVLDAGQAVTAKQLTVSTPTPGWQAKVFATRSATIPAGLTGWTTASSTFTMTGTTLKVPLDGPPARYFLLWITKLTGVPGKWAASVSDLRLAAASP